MRLAGIVIGGLCVILRFKDAVDGLWHFLVNIYDLMVPHVLKHKMYGYKLLVPMKQRVLNKSSKEQNKTV